MDIRKISVLISAISLVLPIAVALFRLKNMDVTLRLFLYFLVYSLSVEIIGSLFLGLQEVNNMFIFNLYSFVEMLFYSFILLKFKNSTFATSRFLFLFCMVLFGWIVLIFVKGYFIDSASNETVGSNRFMLGINEFNEYFLAIKSIALILLSAALLLYLSQNSFNLPSDPRFWICLGVLVYFTINIAVFSSYFIPVEVGGNLKTALGKFSWLIHNFINVIANLLFAIGINQTKNTSTD